MPDAPPPPALPPGWAKLLALGVLLLAAGLPVVYALPGGTLYPLGASLRVLGGLLAVLALSQLCRPPRTSLKARRAILVAAFLLAVGVGLLLVGSSPGAPRLADDASAPIGIGFAIPLVAAALLGAAWGGIQALRSLARRAAWSRGSRAFDRAVLATPAALLCSLAASTTLCVLGLALEAPLDPSSYPSFSIAAATTHAAAAAFVIQAIAACLRDQAQLRGERVELAGRLALGGRAGWLAFALVLAPTLGLELARALDQLQTPSHAELSRVAAVWTPAPRPVRAKVYAGHVGLAGEWEGFGALKAASGPPHASLPLPADDPLAAREETLTSLAWSLSLTRGEERCLRLEERLSLVVGSQGPLALRVHTERALGAQGYRVVVETRCEDPLRGTVDPSQARYVIWVALLSGAGEPRLGGCFGGDPLAGLAEGYAFAPPQRALWLPGYEALWPRRAPQLSPPQSEAGLAYVVRLQGALSLAAHPSAAPSPGEVRLEAWDERHSYRVDSEQLLRARSPAGAHEARASARRERRLPWRGEVR